MIESSYVCKPKSKSIAKYPRLLVLFWKSERGKSFHPVTLFSSRLTMAHTLRAGCCYCPFLSLFINTRCAYLLLSEYAMSAEGSPGPAHFHNREYCVEERLAVMPSSPPTARLPVSLLRLRNTAERRHGGFICI